MKQPRQRERRPLALAGAFRLAAPALALVRAGALPRASAPRAAGLALVAVRAADLAAARGAGFSPPLAAFALDAPAAFALPGAEPAANVGATGSGVVLGGVGLAVSGP